MILIIVWENRVRFFTFGNWLDYMRGSTTAIVKQFSLTALLHCGLSYAIFNLYITSYFSNG